MNPEDDFKSCGKPGDKLYLVGVCEVCFIPIFSTAPKRITNCGYFGDDHGNIKLTGGDSLGGSGGGKGQNLGIKSYPR